MNSVRVGYLKFGSIFYYRHHNSRQLLPRLSDSYPRKQCFGTETAPRGGLFDEHDEKGTGSIEVLTSNNRVMKRYEFYRNQKITVIDCRYFSFEAENLETAVQKIKDLCADGQLDELSNDPTYQEDAAYQIPGTEYPLDIENNNGDPTVMIYSAADGTCITDNLPISTGITQTKNILMNETMNLHEYYRNHKDAINASIMDIACDLAVGRLLNAHDAPFETFVEADDPDDPDSGTHYKEEYQKEYDTYYDKEYARVAKLMKFDYCQEDGVAASPEDTNT